MPTGRPFTLRCPKCKKWEDYKSFHRYSSESIEKTGRTKRCKSGYRYDVLMTEVRHKCGHTWWTNYWHVPRVLEES